MRLPSGKREPSPLQKQMRENREQRRRQSDARHEENAKVVARLRTGEGTRTA